MHIFMVSLCIGLALAVPQGYKYQTEGGLTDTRGNQVTPNQLQALQQYSPQIQIQQQQPQFLNQDQFAGQIPQSPQTFTVEQNGLSLGKQLLQNSQQIIQYEQQQQQLSSVQPQQLHDIIPPPAPVVEPSQQPLIDNGVQHKSLESLDSQPEFIIKNKRQSQEEPDSQTSAAQSKIVFQKEFYYLSAPQEEYEIPKDLDDQLKTIKKNLRVVFIKAPENNGLEMAALQLAQQSTNAQTAIYVLTKQHDTTELSKKLQSIKSATPQRPEVVFIKYRTPEEADHAQRVIQSQYEALNGPNHINRPNTALIHDFVGSKAASSVDPRKANAVVGSAAVTNGKVEKVGFSKPVSKYLPASVKH